MNRLPVPKDRKLANTALSGPGSSVRGNVSIFELWLKPRGGYVIMWNMLKSIFGRQTRNRKGKKVHFVLTSTGLSMRKSKEGERKTCRIQWLIDQKNPMGAAGGGFFCHAPFYHRTRWHTPRHEQNGNTEFTCFAARGRYGPRRDKPLYPGCNAGAAVH